MSSKKVMYGTVAILAEAFGREISDTGYRAYELGLKGLTAEQIQIAGQRALERCRFMPTPAELRHMIFGTPDERAERAWSVVRDALERHRSDSDGFDFGNPAVHATIRGMGGLAELRHRLRNESEAFARKEFIAAFMAHEAMGVGNRFGLPFEPKGSLTQTHRIDTGLLPLQNPKALQNTSRADVQQIAGKVNLGIARIDDENRAAG